MASLLKNLAPDYDSSASYVKGDRVVYNKHFYECLSSTTGTFDSDKWKEIYITKIIKGTGEASAKVSGKTGNKLVELENQTDPNDDGLYVADCVTSISKADYDTLPATKLTDNITYFVEKD